MRPLCFSNAANSVRAVDFQVCKCVLRRLTAVTHISQKSVPKSRFLPASPSREKPLVQTCSYYDRMKYVESGTKASPLGEKLSAQLTDVGHRRRRKQHDLTIRINVRQIRTLRFLTLLQGPSRNNRALWLHFLAIITKYR